MILRHARRTALALAALCIPLAVSTAGAQQVIWRGRSGGFDITWTHDDISARRVSDGAVVFSVRRIFDHDVREMTADHDDEVPMTEYEEQYRILSVIGSVISVVDETYCDCGGAHPIAWTRFVAYDLARGTAAHPFAVSAADLVSERDLLNGLQQDRLLRQAMTATHSRTFTSLAQLTTRLKLQEIQPAGDECTYTVGEEFPSSWAVHHLENGRAALRFSLSHDVEVCRGKYVQVGVLAAPAPRVLPDLQAADARRAGFLMKDARAIAANRATTLNWQRARPKR
jgi:hypothetical protein